jgi:hypothetical protein
MTDDNQFEGDKQAAERVRAALAELHEALISAKRRNLKVDLSLGGISYGNFDPNNAAMCSIIREWLV